MGDTAKLYDVCSHVLATRFQVKKTIYIGKKNPMISDVPKKRKIPDTRNNFILGEMLLIESGRQMSSRQENMDTKKFNSGAILIGSPRATETPKPLHPEAKDAIIRWKTFIGW